jgi:hypothetical protein
VIKRRTNVEQRRALELLAPCRDGCTESILLAHGFTVAQMVELVRAGLATASAWAPGGTEVRFGGPIGIDAWIISWSFVAARRSAFVPLARLRM